MFIFLIQLTTSRIGNLTRLIETRLVVGIPQLCGYKVRKTGAASPLKLPEQVDDDVLTINVVKFSSMAGGLRESGGTRL